MLTLGPTARAPRGARAPLGALLLGALGLFAAGEARAQEDAAPDAVQDASVAAPREDEGGVQVVVAPIPQTDPALGAGIMVVGMLLYEPNENSGPWTTGIGALYTDSESWAVGLFQKASLRNDHLRVTAIAAYGDFNIDFYGVGGDAASSGRSVGLNQRGAAFVTQALFEATPDLYIGPRLRVISLDTSLTSPPPPDLGIDPIDLELHGVSASLGISAEYDTRDSEYSPHAGVYLTAEWMRAASGLGSDFSYDKAQFALNAYHPLGEEAVLAARAYYCSASDGAPFFDLCLFGAHNDLRGYSSGQYRDRQMFSTQVEYRRHLFGRFGMTAFAGVGGVAPQQAWDDATILPAGGVGLRFEASRQYRLNVSIDAAVGDGSSGVYVYIGEAF